MSLKELKHHLFFLVACFQISLLFLFEYHNLALIFTGLLFLRIIALKKPIVLLACLVSCFLAIGFFFMNKHIKDVNIIQTDKAEVILYPDSLVIDGDFIKGVGQSLETKQKHYFQYKIKNMDEKAYLENVVHPLVIESTLKQLEPSQKRNLNGFDYERYLRIIQVNGIYQIESFSKVGRLDNSLGHPLFLLSSFRQKISKHIHKTFEPMTASYMDTLMLGKQSTDVREVWQQLSLSHLFALSGVHVSFLILLTRHLLLRIGISKEITGYFEIVTVLLFFALSGFAVGVVRAGMQELVKRTNKWLELELSALDCFSITLLIHSLFTPFLLLTVGGQLSYYLSFLILFIQPTLLSFSHLKQSIYFQILLTFFSIPLICFYFYQIHVLSVLLSLLVTPVLFGFMLPMLLFSLLLSPLLPSLLISIIETLMMIIHQLPLKFSKVSFFTMTTGKPPLWLLMIVIGIEFYIFIKWESQKLSIKKLLSYFIITLMLLVCLKYINPQGMIAVVDVGQGDAIFIQLPFHRGNYLIDTGGQLDFKKEDWQEKANQRRNAEYTLIPFLKSQGVSSLSTVFLTHAHEDHFGDIDVLHQHIPIQQVIGTTSTINSPNVQKKLTSLHTTEVRSLSIPTYFRKQDMMLEAIYPKVATDGQNNDSLVFKMWLHNKSYLFTGDLERQGEEELLRDLDADLSVDYLKVGHHGSKTSTHKEFVKRITPKEAFISCGVNNRFNHPSKETLETLESEGVSIYRTDEDGMIYQTWFYFSKNMSKTKTIR